MSYPAFPERAVNHARDRLRCRLFCAIAALALVAASHAQAPVTYERLLNAAKEPQNWLTYGGDYFSTRYSTLTQITPANVKNLKLQWVYQSPVAGNWQTTPLVVDGIMYLTQRPNDVVALDALDRPRVLDLPLHPNRRSHRLLRREQPRRRDSRRHAVHGHARRAPDRDRREERPAASGRRRSPTSKPATRSRIAPLVVKDKVIVGVGGGEYGIRGFIAAYDARTGKELWRFYTIPGPGEPGHETWEPCPPNPKTLLRSRGVEARRRIDLGDRLVRSAAEPHLLGHRQRRPRLQRRAAARRQPLHRLGRRARRRHRHAALALPVHAARRYDYDAVQVPVLVDITGSGAPRQGDVVGESQRQLLRARSRDGPIPARQAVREGELDERIRRERPTDSDAAAAGHADLSGNSGRNQLVLAVVQSAHEVDLRLDVGRERADLRRHPDRL